MGINFRGQVWKRVPENDIFWSEIGSGFGELDSTPPPKIQRSNSHPRVNLKYVYLDRCSVDYSLFVL